MSEQPGELEVATLEFSFVLAGTDRDVRRLMKTPVLWKRNPAKASGCSDISVSRIRTSWRVHPPLWTFVQQDAVQTLKAFSPTDRDVRTGQGKKRAEVRTSWSVLLTQVLRQFGHLGQQICAGTDISVRTGSDISASSAGGVRTSRPVSGPRFGHLGQFSSRMFGHLGQFGSSTVGQNGDFSSFLMMIILFIHHFSFFNHMTSTSALP